MALSGVEIVAMVAVLCYCNGIGGKFTYDDTFAITTNYDVIGPGWRLPDIFVHDFWGQDISASACCPPVVRAAWMTQLLCAGKTDSHKSYRPLTIAWFRLDFLLWVRFEIGMGGEREQGSVPVALLRAACAAALLSLQNLLAAVCGAV